MFKWRLFGLDTLSSIFWTNWISLGSGLGYFGSNLSVFIWIDSFWTSEPIFYLKLVFCNVWPVLLYFHFDTNVIFIATLKPLLSFCVRLADIYIIYANIVTIFYCLSCCYHISVCCVIFPFRAQMITYLLIISYEGGS